jgi:restriction system protein
MAIPDYQSIMLPLLRFAADEKEHSLREAIEGLSGKFGLTDAEKKELLPSGQQPTFDNRVAWARTYMTKAALLESPRRGYFRITQRGREVLSKRLTEINVKNPALPGRAFNDGEGFPPLRYGLPFIPALPSGAFLQVS